MVTENNLLEGFLNLDGNDALSEGELLLLKEGVNSLDRNSMLESFEVGPVHIINILDELYDKLKNNNFSIDGFDYSQEQVALLQLYLKIKGFNSEVNGIITKNDIKNILDFKKDLFDKQKLIDDLFPNENLRNLFYNFDFVSVGTLGDFGEVYIIKDKQTGLEKVGILNKLGNIEIVGSYEQGDENKSYTYTFQMIYSIGKQNSFEMKFKIEYGKLIDLSDDFEKFKIFAYNYFFNENKSDIIENPGNFNFKFSKNGDKFICSIVNGKEVTTLIFGQINGKFVIF